MHTWDPDEYERHSTVQEDWARRCLALLRLNGDERILDIGCGDGRITAELAAMVPRESVVGIDSSPEMIAHASAKHGGRTSAGPSFAVGDATRLTYSARFDLVVSFNCLHWVVDQRAVLAGVARALAPGGRTFLHFAGRGNVAGLRAVVEDVAARATWRDAFSGFGFPWCFPDAASYHALVEESGLVPDRVELLVTEMPHRGVPAFAGWLRTTWLPYLERLPGERREAFVADVVAAYLRECPPDTEGRITVDAVRLEVEARRSESPR